MSVDVERPVVRRLRVRGWLRTLSSLHLGGAAHDPNAPLPVAVDGQGRLYVPGSGLTGALRALLGTPQETAPLWGHAEPGTRNLTVSRFVVRDALICTAPTLDDDGHPTALMDPVRLETRFSVGIDRVTGTAAHGFLHAREVVPRGCLLRFELDLNSDIHASLEDDRREVHRVLSLLASRRLRLGAAKTRGLGRVVLVADLTEVYEHDLTSADGLFAVLRGEDGTTGLVVKDEERQQRDAALPPFLDIEVAWRPLAPVMVRASVSGFDVDALPLASSVSPETVAPVLPGSALKGVLRSHAERIERTAARRTDAETATTADPNAPAPKRSAAFRRQLGSLPAANALFGNAPENRHRLDNCGNSGNGRPTGTGAVTVDDCYANAEIPARLWARLQEPPETSGEGESSLETLREEHGMSRADHVALDRWTGGAADGLLFSVLEPHAVWWEPLALTVNLTRLGRWQHNGRPLADAAEALLLLTLRDLQAGRIRLGFATNRGMGDIEVTSVTLKRSGDETTAISLDELLASDRAAELTAAWAAYLDNGSAA